MNNFTVFAIVAIGVLYFLVRVAGFEAEDIGPAAGFIGWLLAFILLLAFGLWGLRNFWLIVCDVWKALRHG